MVLIISRLLRSLPKVSSIRAMSSENSVLFKEEGAVGTITLNKPKALNAINLCMVHQITEKLKMWENEMRIVVIEGNGRAFCAGGDVVAITKDYPNKINNGKEFFRAEYAMNYLIGNYKIPYVALIDGITMGGGVGLSLHGRYRIATEKTMFAMPETAIGLFPDVGATYILSRLPGGIGMYLALTGARLGGQECLNYGLATHFIESKDIPNLKDAFANCKIKANSIDADLLKYTKDVKTCANPLKEGPELIDKIFVLPTIEEIYEALKKEGSGWSLDTIKTLNKMSPIALKVTMKAMLDAKNKTLKDVLLTDFKIGSNALNGSISKDFYEGVRAMLVDKDKNPKWNPATIEEVSDEMVCEYFNDPGDELKLKL